MKSELYMYNYMYNFTCVFFYMSYAVKIDKTGKNVYEKEFIN